MHHWTFTGEAALAAFAARLAQAARPGDIIALSGDLGAGKTSFARGLLLGLGHEGEVPSPSFTLVQTYEAPPLALPVWHVDLFRLSAPGEALALGLEEAEDALLVIEWPERLGSMLHPSALRLRLEGAGEPHRILTAQVPPPWKDRWPPT